MSIVCIHFFNVFVWKFSMHDLSFIYYCMMIGVQDWYKARNTCRSWADNLLQYLFRERRRLWKWEKLYMGRRSRWRRQGYIGWICSILWRLVNKEGEVSLRILDQYFGCWHQGSVFKSVLSCLLNTYSALKQIMSLWIQMYASFVRHQCLSKYDWYLMFLQAHSSY